METNIKTIEQMLEEWGLNWRVFQDEMVTKTNVTALVQNICNEYGLNFGELSSRINNVPIIPDHRAIVREDNNNVLSINGDGYNPYQNHEMMETLIRISDKSGFEIHKCGMFDDGRKVFIQLKGKDLKLGTDTIKGFLTSIDSKDGSTSAGWGNSNLTISCLNTFWAGYAQLHYKVRHTANMRIKIEDLLKQLEVAVAREEQIFATIKKMSEVKIDDKVRQLVTNRLFDLKNEDKLADISTAKRNKMDRFYFDLTTELKDKDETLWGLFSGVTRYTTHSMKNGKDNTEGKIFGAIGNKERAIWHTLAEMVE